MSSAFPRSARLLRPSDYRAALRGRRVKAGPLFVVHRARGAGDQAARLGLIVPRRHVPRAVGRNTIRRVLRESFRAHRSRLPDGDLVFRLVARPRDGSLTQLRAAVRAEAERFFSQIAS